MNGNRGGQNADKESRGFSAYADICTVALSADLKIGSIVLTHGIFQSDDDKHMMMTGRRQSLSILTVSGPVT